MSWFARTPQLVRIPPDSSARTFTPNGATSWARDSVNPPTAHLAAWYGELRQPAADRGYLKNAAALLLSHDRYRRAAHVYDSIKIVSTTALNHSELNCLNGAISP